MQIVRTITANLLRNITGLTPSIGLQPRTLEVLQTLGLREDLESKGNRVGEVAFWGRDSKGKLILENIGTDNPNPTPYPYSLVIDQEAVESALKVDLKKRGHAINHSMELLDYSYESLDFSLWPITAFIKNHVSGAVEVWHAAYLLGADGSNSKVRRLTSIATEPFGTETTWAIADLHASTTFPDIRRRVRIRSIHGSCLLVPNKTRDSFRLTTMLSAADLSTLTAKEYTKSLPQSVNRRLASSTTLLLTLSSRLTAVLAPYPVSISSIDYIGRYSSTKRLATHFSDPTHHIFLLGDAAHTHSPLTKQSLNSGLMDAWNLTWKLAVVHKSLANPNLLATYHTERHAFAKACLEFEVAMDQEFAVRQNGAGANTQLGEQNFLEAAGWITGCGIQYQPSSVVKEEVRTLVKKGIEPLVPGKRLLPLKLTRHIDGNEVQLLDEVPTDGRFTLVIFVGELLTSAVFASLAMVLESVDSPLRIGAGVEGREEGLVKIVLVHSELHLFLMIQDLPVPFSRNAWDIFEDVGGKAHGAVGASTKLGALCLVRPDGVVALVSNLDDCRGVTAFLKGMLIGNERDEDGNDGTVLAEDADMDV